MSDFKITDLWSDGITYHKVFARYDAGELTDAQVQNLLTARLCNFMWEVANNTHNIVNELKDINKTLDKLR